MTHVITGGAGFIGGHLATRLAAAGHDVMVLDDLSTGHAKNVPSGVQLVETDIRDVSADDVAGATHVYHLAARPSVARSVEDPVGSLNVNVDGTAAVLEACRQASVQHFVFAASSSAYGDVDVLPKHEELPPAPMSPYAASKVAGEALTIAYGHTFNFHAAALRLFNVYGPRQDPNSAYAAVIPAFLRAALDGRPLPMDGDGMQSRDFTYVDDVADAFVRAANTSGARGKVLNVGAGDRTSLRALGELVHEVVGQDSGTVQRPPRAGDVRHSQASTKCLQAALGWCPETSLREGLAKTAAWMRT